MCVRVRVYGVDVRERKEEVYGCVCVGGGVVKVYG